MPGTGLQSTFEGVADVARRTSGALSVALTFVDEEAKLLRVRWSIAESFLDRIRPTMERFGLGGRGADLPIREGSLTAAAQMWPGPRSYVRFADLESQTYPRELLVEFDRLLNVGGVRVHPLRVDGRHLGLMVFAMARPLETSDEELLDTFALQATLILQNAILARTLERRVEERTREHREALDALQEKTHALELANAELREVDRAKSDFLATVSHELRTPLVSIQGYNELMLREALGPISSEQRRGLTVAVRNLGLLVDLIDNLLYFAQRQHEVREAPTTTVDLVSVVDDAVELVRARATERGVKVAIERPTERLAVRANRYEIHRLVVNLLSNAIKFNRERDGAVRVIARAAGGQAELTVLDTGIGIAEAEQARVFERFYQVDGSRTRRYGGAGIGLAVALEIARTHGGSISLASEPGQGAAFTVKLPLLT